MSMQLHTSTHLERLRLGDVAGWIHASSLQNKGGRTSAELPATFRSEVLDG